MYSKLAVQKITARYVFILQLKTYS